MKLSLAISNQMLQVVGAAFKIEVIKIEDIKFNNVISKLTVLVLFQGQQPLVFKRIGVIRNGIGIGIIKSTIRFGMKETEYFKIVFLFLLTE